MIEKITIKNFKKFSNISLEFHEGVNILVGDNCSGKSTILDAILMALNGRSKGYSQNDVSEDLFHRPAVERYLEDVSTGRNSPPPEISIELFFPKTLYPEFRGTPEDSCGISYRVKLKKEVYESLKKTPQSLPVECYEISWRSFAGEALKESRIEKPHFIDLTDPVFQRDVNSYMAKKGIQILDPENEIKISQSSRESNEDFINSFKEKNLGGNREIFGSKVEISPKPASKENWKESLETKINGIPFNYIGKGNQGIFKAHIALERKRDKEILLFEEPENHLSASNLSRFLESIIKNFEGTQVIITTHNSFAANRLGLEKVIFLGTDSVCTFNGLSEGTKNFFKKSPSYYDTLRFILCRAAFLVEGSSDSLIVEKVYLKEYGKLPSEDGIEIISVGTAYKRFLEIARETGQITSVVKDSDWNVEILKNVQKDYDRDRIRIFFDENIDSGDIKNFNYNTLEPKILKKNGISRLNEIFGSSYESEEKILSYMLNNKADCALKIFDSNEEIDFPEYLLEAARWIKEKI